LRLRIKVLNFLLKFHSCIRLKKSILILVKTFWEILDDRTITKSLHTCKLLLFIGFKVIWTHHIHTLFYWFVLCIVRLISAILLSYILKQVTMINTHIYMFVFFLFQMLAIKFNALIFVTIYFIISRLFFFLYDVFFVIFILITSFLYIFVFFLVNQDSSECSRCIWCSLWPIILVFIMFLGCNSKSFRLWTCVFNQRYNLHLFWLTLYITLIKI
jgi:hypothetical protein